jgi:putative glutamine amidotransferase
MKAAISQKIIINDKGVRMDALEQDYNEYFSRLGLDLIPIPNTLKNVADYLDVLGVERIIISGGNSINPNVKAGELEVNDRDKTEKELLEYALAKNLPVLGICRGAQFINVYFGGGLLKDLKICLNGAVEHVAARHAVSVPEGGSAGFDIPGDFEVNSYHNDGFTEKELSPEVATFAIAEDGTVEGFRHKSKNITGILWHPERDGMGLSGPSRKIVDFFINKNK